MEFPKCSKGRKQPRQASLIAKFWA